MADEQKWYSLERINRYPVSYRIIIGERSNGKTYSVKEYVQRNFKMGMGKFVYLRRTAKQISRKEMKELFSDQNEIAFELFDDYIHYTTDLGFHYYNENGEAVTIGRAFCVEEGAVKKGIPWNEYTTIFFDEFLEYGNPIENEIAKFINVISTIVRKRDNVNIFLIANTVTKLSEYFKLFGIDIKKLKQGQIYFGKHSNGVTYAIEYCSSSNIVDGKKQKNKYVGFDNNPTSNMILYGEWEYDIVNTSSIDGIGWNSKRRLLPFYCTANGEVYEISLYESEDPITFVRKINTQCGEVRKEIKYNLSYDNSLQLVTKAGIVPTYSKFNSLIDKETLTYWDITKLCIDAKRVVYDKIESGSDFMKIYPYISK